MAPALHDETIASALHDLVPSAPQVTLNDPDLVLFVGEALAGNEAVDQASGSGQHRRGSPLSL